MQAVQDSDVARGAIHKSGFVERINRYTSAVELEIPSDSTWEVIAEFPPAKVLLEDTCTRILMHFICKSPLAD